MSYAPLSESCSKGHPLSESTYRTITRRGKEVRQRVCLACKREWNKARYHSKRTVSQKNMTGLENRAEFNTPTLQVAKLKPTLDVILDNGARLRWYPCVVPEQPR